MNNQFTKSRGGRSALLPDASRCVEGMPFWLSKSASCLRERPKFAVSFGSQPIPAISSSTFEPFAVSLDPDQLNVRIVDKGREDAHRGTQEERQRDGSEADGQGDRYALGDQFLLQLLGN